MNVWGRMLDELLSAQLPKSASYDWFKRCQNLVSLATQRPLEDFLIWTEDLERSEFNESFSQMYDDLLAHPESERWARLVLEVDNLKHHPLARDKRTSPSIVQQAFHLACFEAHTKHSLWSGMDTVVEVGGGFGNFARMLYDDGFRGRYVILDLPQIVAFQRAYLAMVGIDDDYVSFGIPEVLGNVAFVACWSLSETPLAYRQTLFPWLHAETERYLIVTQTGEYHGVNNMMYFDQFMSDAKAEWTIRNVPYAPEDRYLFGVKS